MGDVKKLSNRKFPANKNGQNDHLSPLADGQGIPTPH
jgi:hypothetical protein